MLLVGHYVMRLSAIVSGLEQIVTKSSLNAHFFLKGC